jgi:hypothetical protein
MLAFACQSASKLWQVIIEVLVTVQGLSTTRGLPASWVVNDTGASVQLPNIFTGLLCDEQINQT